ncbi:hypothetical protein HX018_07290 [Sphingobacterium hotanense]|uniref:Uncharacterized protein n=1 Tax=Sphingobacterium hotanense TaxID=649196 RepID=A0ABT7NLE7_9SPHI|nr:hypothetical protein [Sphingobacterium hotanense]
MVLDFSEDDMVDYLLQQGFIISFRVEVFDENIYQNVFSPTFRIIIEAIKNNELMPLETAFKKQLLNQI